MKSSVEIKKLKDIHIIDSLMICIGKGLDSELYYQKDKPAIRIISLLSYGTKLP